MDKQRCFAVGFFVCFILAFILAEIKLKMEGDSFDLDSFVLFCIPSACIGLLGGCIGMFFAKKDKK